MANTGWISNPNSHSYIEFESINGSSTCESNKITFHEIQGDDSNGYPAEVAVNIDDELINYGTITKVIIKYKAQGTNNWQRGTCRTGYLNSSDSKTWSNTHKEGVAQRSESAKSWEDTISNPTRSKNGKYRMLIGMQNYQWVTKLTVYISEIQIYIEYTPASYTLTVTAGAGGTVSGGGTYERGSTATLIATPNTGYKFVGWNDGNTSATRTVTVNGNATYTATFEKINPPVYVKDKQCSEIFVDETNKTIYFAGSVSYTDTDITFDTVDGWHFKTTLYKDGKPTSTSKSVEKIYIGTTRIL